jgi:DNA invertase Pin-like site-specific DNA recombinase
MSAESAKKVVAYYRVSTKRQGASGLGLEGQQTAVADYASRNGATLVAAYTEVETGKRADREQLGRALSHARRSKATLLVAKLDRLARNVAFTSALMESGVDFIACDNPHANRFTVHILAAVAEHEAEQISQRTKAALKAAKARGTLLGSARPGHWAGREEVRLSALEKARQAAADSHRQAAVAAYDDLIPTMQEMRKSGCTLQQIADRLNADDHETRSGKPWSRMQVLRVLKRAAE